MPENDLFSVFRALYCEQKEDGTRRQVIFPYPDRLSHHVTTQFLAMDKETVVLWESVYGQ